MNRIWNILIVLAVFMSLCLHAQSQSMNLSTNNEQETTCQSDPLCALGKNSVLGTDSITPDNTIPELFRILTTDRIYYKGKCYRPMHTPLHGRIDGYDEFYPFLPDIAAQFELGGGKIDKRYTLVWLLENDRLYLANIEIDSDLCGHTQEEINATMEQYLGDRFKKNIPVSDSSGLDLRFGLMPADWLDGSIFVRQQFDVRPEESEGRWERYLEWDATPFQELIFKKGQLQQIINRKNTKDINSVLMHPELLKK